MIYHHKQNKQQRSDKADRCRSHGMFHVFLSLTLLQSRKFSFFVLAHQLNGGIWYT